MSFSFSSRVIAVSAATSAVMACSAGGSGGLGNGSGGVATSIPSGRTLDSLSQSEQSQYCHDLAAASEQALSSTDTSKPTCASRALSSAMSLPAAERKSGCQSAYADCMKSATNKSPATKTDTSECEAASFSGCSATVGEVNACVGDTYQTLRTLYAQYDTYCDNIDANGNLNRPASTSSSNQTPPSCSSTKSKCPQLFGRATVGTAEPDPAP